MSQTSAVCSCGFHWKMIQTWINWFILLKYDSNIKFWYILMFAVFWRRKNRRYASSTRVKNRRNLSRSIKRKKKVLTVFRRLIICKLIICTLTTIWFKLIGFDSIYNVLNHFSLFWIILACFESMWNVLNQFTML